MVFINGIGCNFNLGKFKSEKLTELFVVRVRNRQIKLSTGVENSLE